MSDNFIIVKIENGNNRRIFAKMISTTKNIKNIVEKFKKMAYFTLE